MVGQEGSRAGGVLKGHFTELTCEVQFTTQPVQTFVLCCSETSHCKLEMRGLIEVAGIKDASELHYGGCRIQWFWSLTHNTDEKLGFFSLCFINQSPLSPPSLCRENTKLAVGQL